MDSPAVTPGRRERSVSEREPKCRTGLRVPGDFCVTERVHVNYSADRPGAAGARRITHVAVQQWLGLLPERWPRAGGRHCAYSGADGTNLSARRNGLSTVKAEGAFSIRRFSLRLAAF